MFSYCECHFRLVVSLLVKSLFEHFLANNWFWKIFIFHVWSICASNHQKKHYLPSHILWQYHEGWFWCRFENCKKWKQKLFWEIVIREKNTTFTLKNVERDASLKWLWHCLSSWEVFIKSFCVQQPMVSPLALESKPCQLAQSWLYYFFNGEWFYNHTQHNSQKAHQVKLSKEPRKLEK